MAVTFDLTKITARDVSTFAKSDIEAQAAALAKCVTSCPKTWGEPGAIDTYLDLPWTEYQDVQRQLVEELASTGKA